jgi:hypothetical protein
MSQLLVELEIHLTAAISRTDIYLRQFARKLKLAEEEWQKKEQLFLEKQRNLLIQQMSLALLLRQANQHKEKYVAFVKVRKQQLENLQLSKTGWGQDTADPVFQELSVTQLIQQADQKKSYFRSIPPPKNAFQESRIPKPLSALERHEALRYHRYVITLFIHAHLKGTHLNALEAQLNMLFSPDPTDPRRAQAAYVNLNTLLQKKSGSIFSRKNRLNNLRRQELVGYLAVLYENNLFAFTNKENFPVVLRAVDMALRNLFKEINKEKIGDKSIEYFYYSEQHGEFWPKEMAPAPVSVPFQVSGHRPKKVYAQETKQGDIISSLGRFTENSLGPVESVSAVKSSVDTLLRTAPVKKNVSGLGDYVEEVNNACLKIEKLKTEADVLEKQLNVLRHKRERQENLHKLLKYQIAAGCGLYRQAVSNLSFPEKCVHTAEGLNAATRLLLSIKDSSFVDTVKIFAKFLQESTTLRDKSLRTILLQRVLHAPVYGFMKLSDEKKAGDEEIARSLIKTQLDQYTRQMDLETALTKPDCRVTLVEPNEMKPDLVNKALAAGVGDWSTLFCGGTRNRRLICEKTAKGLTDIALASAREISPQKDVVSPDVPAHSVGVVSEGIFGKGLLNFLRRDKERVVDPTVIHSASLST